MARRVSHVLDTDYKLENYGYGEWVEEPDLILFNYKQIKCRIVRDINFGFLGGYIQIPKDHPWILTGKYNLNFIDSRIDYKLKYLEKEEDKEFWIGFYCDSDYDYKPKSEYKGLIYKNLIKNANISTYKNIKYVERQCEVLVNDMLKNCKESQLIAT